MAIYSDILKELRIEKNINQTDMAKRFGIKQATYSLYENGKRKMSIEMLEILADELDTSTDYILGRASNKKPYPKRNIK